MMKKSPRYQLNFFWMALVAFFSALEVGAQGEVAYSGSTWTATVNGSSVYSGSRMFDAVNAACAGMGSGTIHIRNSGNSGNDNGGSSVYAINPRSNQTLDFHGNTVHCNSAGELAVAVYADRKSGVTVKNLKVTGDPRYAIWFRGCSDMTFTNIDMNLSHPAQVGLGIRVDASTGSASNLTINGDIRINGSKGHAIETYSIDGVDIGDVTVNNSGGCGILLNDSENCTVGVVRGTNNNTGGGYATFRVANNNRTTYCEAVYSINSGRGFFSVSGSQNCTIGYVEISGATDIGIWIQDSYNTQVSSGYVWNTPCYAITNGSGNSVSVNCNAPGNGSGTSYVQIQNSATGLYIDGLGRSNNGAACGQYSNTTSLNAQWELIDVGNNYYQLRNRGTGMYLDGLGSFSNGTTCGQWANTTHENSHWARELQSSGYVKLRNRATGMYIDGLGSSANASNLGLWSSSNHANQQWSLLPASGSRVQEQLNRHLVEAEQLSADVLVSPNPVSQHGRLVIQLPAEHVKVNLKITDLAGRALFFHDYEHTHEIALRPGLRSGIYLMLLDIDGMQFTRRLVVK